MDLPRFKLKRTLLAKAPAEGAAAVTLASLLFLVAVFHLYQTDSFGISDLLSATSAQVFGRHEIWRAFTAPLVHADLQHLGDNAIFFGGLSFLLGGYFGPRVFPLLSFLAGGVINLLVLPFYPDSVSIVGASGIVYFMAAFWLTLYYGIERETAPARRLANMLAFTLILLFPETLHERVSYLSHAVGFALGAAAGIPYFLAHRSAIRAHEVWVEEEPDLCDDPGLENFDALPCKSAS